MNENYIVINGKKIELTEEQLKQLGIEPEKKRKNPFERVKPNERYYYVESSGVIEEYNDANDTVDNKLYKISNYFNYEAFAKQVALRQLIYRKLLKFAYDNECEDTEEWDGSNTHWTVRYNGNLDEFFAYSQERYKARDVYFSSEEGAKRAIKEVVDPFMKEHPEFVW
jgi:hypothetical protein